MSPKYVKVANAEGSEERELPLEDDDTLLVSTLSSQFDGCSSLTYSNPQTNTIRAVRLDKGKLHLPQDVDWSNLIFYCVFPQEKAEKRTEIKLKCTDLKVTEEKLKNYFQNFGDVISVKIDTDKETGQLTGYVTIKFYSEKSKERAMERQEKTDNEMCNYEIIYFQRTTNTPGVGAEYEYLVAAHFALLLNQNNAVTDFTLRSNVPGFGKWDDLIIDVEMNNKKYNFAFQIKHKESDNPQISATSLEAKGDFNLEQYCETYKDLKKMSEMSKKELNKLVKGNYRELFQHLKSELENYYFILYTNAIFLPKDDKTDICKYTIIPQNDKEHRNHFSIKEKMFHNCSAPEHLHRFRLKYEKSEESEKKDDKKFFSQFTLYSGRKNVKGLEESIRETLKNENVYLKYINLFKNWHRGEFSNKILTKRTLNIQIIDIFLSPLIITNRYLTNFREEKYELCQKAVEPFDVTVINEVKKRFVNKFPDCQILGNLKNLFPDKIKKALKDLEEEYKWSPEDCAKDSEEKIKRCMLRLAKENKIVNKKVQQLEAEDELKMLRYFFEKTLIIKCGKDAPEDLIYTALDLYRVEGSDVKFILVGENLDVTKLPSHLTFFDNLDKLKGKKDLYDDIIKKCTIFIQGRKEIALKELLKTSKEIGKVIKPHQIFKMLREKYVIGGQSKKLPDYLQRTFSTTSIHLETLLEYSNKQDELLIINFDGRFDNCKQLIEDQNIQVMSIQDYLELDESVNNSLIISTNEGLPNNQFKEISERNQQKNINFLKMVEGNKFLLLKSTKNTFLHRKNYKTCIKENEIHDYLTNPVNILIAQPGMGKSTMLQCLKENYTSDYWTVFVDLKEHNSFFRVKNKYDDVIEHFLKLRVQHKNLLLKMLMETYLEKNKIVWFFDGLDEIEYNCLDNVLTFIEEASATGHRVWISSRQNLQAMLESRLNIFSIGMEKLSEEQQKQYVMKRLELKYETQKVTEIINKLFDNTYIKQNAEMLGVPLHLYIIIENSLDGTEDYENLNESMFILTKMYKRFFEGRYRHFIQKLKSKKEYLIQNTVDDYLENYKIAALHSLLNNDVFAKLQLNLLLKRNEIFLKKIKAGRDPLGIIDKVNNDNKAIFIHNTFTEYFACIFLCENLDKARILKEEFFSARYKNLLSIFNTMISENNNLHLAVIHNNIDYIRKWDPSQVDTNDRNLLHLVACNGTRHPRLEINNDRINDIEIKSFKGEDEVIKEITDRVLQQQKNDPFKNDDIFNWNSLIYALASGSLYVIEKILEKYTFADLNNKLREYYNDQTVMYYCLKFGYPQLLSATLNNNRSLSHSVRCESLKNSNCDSILRFAVMQKYDNTKIIDVLIDKQKETTITSTNRINLPTQNDEFTLLHLAVMESDIRTTEILLSKGANVNSQNYCKQTPLHLAVSQNNIDITKLLLENGANIKIEDVDNRNVLSYAIREKHYDSLRFLKEKGANYNPVALCDAAETGNIKVIKSILDSGFEINGTNTLGETPLHCAIKRKKTEAINFILGKGASVNAKTNAGLSPLHTALSYNNTEAVSILLEKRPNLQAKTNNEETILHFVFDRSDCNAEMLKLLLNKDKISELLKMKDKKGCTPLHTALRYNDNIDAIKILLDKGLHLKEKTNNGETILHCAFDRSDCKIEIIELLLDNPEIIQLLNVTDNKGRTPLHVALCYNNVDVVEMLLQKKPNLNMKINVEEENILHYAVKRKDCKVEIVKLLLSKAETTDLLDATDREGYTPLHTAVRDTDNIDVIKILIERQRNLNTKTKNGETILHSAFKKKECKTELIELLLSKLSLNTTDIEERTPQHYAVTCENVNAIMTLLQKQTCMILHYAVAYGSVEINQILLNTNEALQLLDVTDSKGRTPLHLAILRNNADIVKMLLEKQPNLKIRTTEQQTVLHIALDQTNCNIDIIKMLLNNTELLNETDVDGQTPLHLAVLHGNIDVVKILLEKGPDVSVTTIYQRNVLHQALLNCDCNVELIELLLKIPEVVKLLDVADIQGYTPLHFAIKNGNVGLTELFLKKGVNLDTKTTNGETIINYAVTRGKYNIEIVKLLLKKPKVGDLLNLPNKKQLTPLHYAVHNGSADIVELILNQESVDLESIDADNKNYPLYFARQDGHLNKELLIKMARVIKENELFGPKMNIEKLERAFMEHDMPRSGFIQNIASFFKFR